MMHQTVQQKQFPSTSTIGSRLVHDEAVGVGLVRVSDRAPGLHRAPAAVAGHGLTQPPPPLLLRSGALAVYHRRAAPARSTRWLIAQGSGFDMVMSAQLALGASCGGWPYGQPDFATTLLPRCPPG